MISVLANIEIDWPVEERAGGTLTVNSRQRLLEGGDSIVFRETAGNWQVRLTRIGFEPIERVVETHSGETVRMVPEWTPTARTLQARSLLQLLAEIDRAAALPDAEQNADDLKTRIDQFCREPQVSIETARLRHAASRLAWPADQLAQNQIPTAELHRAGFGNATRAPPSLVAVFGDGRLNHWAESLSLDFSHDGRWIASAGLDQAVLVHEVDTGRLVQWIDPGQTDGACPEVMFHPSLPVLVTCSTTVVAWNVNDGRKLGEIPIRVRSGCFSSDGRILALATGRGAEIYQVQARESEVSFQEQAVIPMPSLVTALRLSDDGDLILTGTKDGEVVVCRTENGEESFRKQIHIDAVRAVGWRSDGRVVTVVDDTLMAVIDTAGDAPPTMLRLGVTYVSSASGTRIYSHGFRAG